MERPNVIPDSDVDSSLVIQPIKYASEPRTFRNKTTEYAADHTHMHKIASPLVFNFNRGCKTIIFFKKLH